MEKNEQYHFGIELDKLPRLARFPFPVKHLGVTRGWFSQDKDMGSHCRDRFEIALRLVSHKKKLIVNIGGKRHDVHFPHIQIKDIGVETSYRPNTMVDTFAFNYEPRTAILLKETLPFPETMIWEMKDMERESYLVNELKSLMEHASEYGVADRIDVLCFELLELLVFDCNYPRVAEKDFHRMKMQTIASYFQLHCREEIDLAKLLEYHGLSRSTFQRHWAEFSGTTPAQYLMDLRLREACRLLKSERNASSSAIASKLNFRNNAYFCALFRKHVGLTPMAYHKLHFGE